MPRKTNRNNSNVYSERELMKHMKNMKGGSGSDYSGSFHAHEGNNASLTRTALQGINGTPLFNPFNVNARFATGTTGIIPTGQYYLSGLGGMTNSIGLRGGSRKMQRGGSCMRGGASKNPWIAHVKMCQQKYGLSYKEAMSDSRTRATYKNYN